MSLHDTPCQFLKGVGPRLAKVLAKCQIFTIQDVLFHLPFRYQDRSVITPIRHLKASEWAVIEGYIKNIQTVKTRQRQFLFTLADSSGNLTLRFFHLHLLQKEQLTIGTKLRCFAEVRYGYEGLAFIHPEYQIINDHTPQTIETLTPIYPSTEGMTQTLWRKILAQALLQVNKLIDYLPQTQWRLADALQYVHNPPLDANTNLLENRQHPSQLRLAFEELLAHHLSLRLRQLQLKQQIAPTLPFKPQEQFFKRLGFNLTQAQLRVSKEISNDMAQNHPMLRLVQGDVGSGKTVVAALAALQCIANGYQVALMAPTEILALQHYHQFTQWLTPLNIIVTPLHAQLTASERRKNLQAVADHTSQILIGTHAIFQKKVNFAKLGLIIIDEQHRFGVAQRLALREKGSAPHQLMMTATPIPRTLAMTLYADLNLSIIDELPPGRTPIKTVLINQTRRTEIMARALQACAEQRQIYWVCPLIEESEVLQCQAAETTANQLRQQLPHLRIGLIHGRLTPAIKAQVMISFKRAELDILVATTVIEVGVDVPNASVMIIENAERLGLAQLHQLRGRVGRGSAESFCLLLYQNPLSQLAEQRLRLMRTYSDGFKIAEADLTQRGPGEWLGTRQTGLLNLRIADLARDQHLLPDIQKQADELLAQHPDYIQPLIDRWIGEKAKFHEA